MTTDSILRSYYNVTSSSFVPFVNPTGAALNLLVGETQGFAIDATTYNTATPALYIGGPVGGTVGVRDTTTPANNLSNVPLDLSNLTQSGTSAKLTHWNTFSGPHNLIRQSEDFTTTWVDGDGSTAANTTANPLNGTVNADTYTQGAADELAQDLVGITRSTQLTFSVYVKAGTATWIRLKQEDTAATGNNQGWFNIATAAAGSTLNTGTGSGAAISGVAVGGGWYRVSLTGVPATARTTGYFAIACVTADAGSTRDSTKTVLIWGAQVNIGPLTDYVPTNAAVSGGARWTPHNICLQSQTFGTTWTVGDGSITSNTDVSPDGTVTADRYTQGATGSLVQTMSLSANTQYTTSMYMKAGTATWMAVYFGNGAGSDIHAFFNIVTGVAGTVGNTGSGSGATSSMSSVGSGWYRVTLSGIPLPSGTGTLECVCGLADGDGNPDSGKTVLLWGAEINRGPIATPYLVTTTATRVGIPQGYDAINSRLGLLIEPAATNLCIRSQEFDNAAWTNTRSSDSANTAIAPDGTLTADSLIEDATAANSHFINSTAFTMVSGSDTTVSVYAKANTRTAVELVLLGSGGNFLWIDVDLTTGAITDQGDNLSANLDDAFVTPVGNGWYRIVVSGNVTSAGTGILQVGLLNSVFASSYNGDGASSVYVWGAQAETGLTPNSYTPTITTSVTKAKDDVRALTSTVPFSTTLGTVYLDVTMGNDQDDYFDINDATVNEAFAWYYDTQPAEWDVTDGGVGQTPLLKQGSPAFRTTRIEVSSAWKLNDFDHSYNGATPATDSAGTLPTVTRFNLGSDMTATPIVPKYLYRVVYVPRQVEDDGSNLSTWRYSYP